MIVKTAFEMTSVKGGEDEDEDEEGVLEDFEEEDEEEDSAGLSVRPKAEATKTMNIALRNVDISKEGKVIVAGREESGRTAMEGESQNISIITIVNR